MTWFDYYANYYDWSESTQYTHLFQVKDLGQATPSDEVTDCLTGLEEKAGKGPSKGFSRLVIAFAVGLGLHDGLKDSRNCLFYFIILFSFIISLASSCESDSGFSSIA